MEQSLFLEYVNKWFPGIVIGMSEKINGSALEPSYLHKRFLTPEYSQDGKWQSITGLFTRVMADVVAMDSSLPLKKRDAILRATGEIPKQGMELKLNETELTKLKNLIKTGAKESMIVQKLFADVAKCIYGIHDRNEFMFLQGLSSGVTLVTDATNVGTGIRLDFGYFTENKFGVTTLWSNPASLPFDDIQRVLDKATMDGNTITRVMLDKTAFNNLAKTTQAKELYAFNQSFVGSNIPSPSLDQMNLFVSSRYGFVFELVDRSLRYEKNGVQTSIKPWQDGAVIFLANEKVGQLVWSELAEAAYPVAGVAYQTSDEYILVSKYRMNRPSLGEFSNSQALVCPVIGAVDQIYQLDSKTLQA